MRFDGETTQFRNIIGYTVFFLCMSWYYVSTGMNANDMFGGVAYIETGIEDLNEIDEEKAHTIVSEVHPDFQSGQYIEDISKMDWKIDSSTFGSEEEFMQELGEVVGTASNDAYSLVFGRCSVKEARKLAD